MIVYIPFIKISQGDFSNKTKITFIYEMHILSHIYVYTYTCLMHVPSAAHNLSYFALNTFASIEFHRLFWS